MAAFWAAWRAGARWVEADVKITSDGVPVLFHDDVLDRTTDGRGAVADADWRHIAGLDAGAWFAPDFAGTRVPTLSDLLLFARETGLRLNLELKPCTGRAQATVMVVMIEITRLWPETLPPPLLSSADIDALLVAAQLHPDWPRSLLIEAWSDDWRAVAARAGVSALHVNTDILTPERVDLLRQTGLPLLGYTVNDPARARDLLRQGFAAVLSDDPAACLAAAV